MSFQIVKRLYKMPHFLRGEVARLVLSYTLDEDLVESTSTFMKECPHIPQVGHIFRDFLDLFAKRTKFTTTTNKYNKHIDYKTLKLNEKGTFGIVITTKTAS